MTTKHKNTNQSLGVAVKSLTKILSHSDLKLKWGNGSYWVIRLLSDGSEISFSPRLTKNDLAIWLSGVFTGTVDMAVEMTLRLDDAAKEQEESDE